MPNSTSVKRSSLIAVSVATSLLLLPAAHLDAADGAQLAAQFCAACHGENLTGARAPALRGGQWRRAHNDEEAMQIIVGGLPNTEMPGFGAALSVDDRAALMAFIRTPPPPRSPVQTAGIFIRSELQTFSLQRVAEGFEVPWSLAFLPDGRMLVTERAGRLRIVDRGLNSLPVSGIPEVWYRQDGGLLSLALDPDYARNGWVYLSYSEPGDEPGTSMTKIVRGRIVDHAWTEQQTIWQVDARYYLRANDHYGCRLLFHRGKLFFSVGERSDRAAAQDISSPLGKIHRIDPDGGIPSDNPFVRTPGAYPSVWSYGHRNPQGLAIDPRTEELWSVEHGPMGGDELNLIEPGGNYGWPEVTFGREHSGKIISTATSKPGMVDPVRQWTPSIAVCPLAFSDSARYPKWKHHLLVGSLLRQEFHRIELADGKLVHEELLFKELGRIRDIQTGPDGYLYLAIEHLDRPGEIVRLMPLD